MEFVALTLVTGFVEKTCDRSSYYKRPSVATEGGPHFTRSDSDKQDVYD
jgi:hypothetical protein